MNTHTACRQFLQTVLLMEQGESLLIYTDSGSDYALVNALAKSAGELGVKVDLLSLANLSDLDSQIQALREKISAGDYQVLCELSAKYYYPSGIWEEAIRNGRRVYCVGSLDEASFIRCIGEPDQQKMIAFGALLRDLISQANRVHISTVAGTDLVGRMQPMGLVEKLLSQVSGNSLPGRALAKLGLTGRSIIWSPDGALKKSGGSTFMGGQLAFRAIPSSLNGTAVIDGYQWPPEELGKLQDPIMLKVKNGRVVNIEGCQHGAARLRQWLGGRDKTIEHFCIGFNPGAGLDGELTEAERAFGHINMGFGKYPYHTDGVMTCPSLTFDDQLFLHNHSFLDPGLAKLERELRESHSTDS